MPAEPFIILALPRSRTYWLSRYLTCGDYVCGHEQARYLRSMADVRSWLSQGYTGTAETSVARWYRLIRHYRPDIRTLVVRRSVADVVDSLMRLDMRGVCTWDRDVLTHSIKREDRALDRVERQPGVMSVRFEDLVREDVCAAVFRHCLGREHDRAHWQSLADTNLQCDMPSLIRYAVAHGAQIDGSAKQMRKQMRRLLGAKLTSAEPEADGVVIAQEPLSIFYRDAKALLSEHCVAVGEPADQYTRKNMPVIQRLEDIGAWQIMTARLNGRILGYLTSIIGPSLEAVDLTIATETLFYVSKDAGGMRIGMRLQRAAIEAARAHGVGEFYMRAGVRGSGERLGVLYKRLGAEDFGQLYKLDLKAA